MFQPLLKNIYIIASPHEDEQRQRNVQHLQKQLPRVNIQPAIFPSETRVPFLQKLQEYSEKRTGLRMNPGEIGVLLSNRAIWREIVFQHNEGYFLILESDSNIKDLDLLLNQSSFIKNYDVFFFGGWYGKMLLKRSTIQQVGQYRFGDAVFKTVCSCYGYAINVKAAKELLKYTGKIAHPVDEFKRYLPEGHLRLGAILPEVISELPSTSSIGHPNYENISFRIRMLLVNLRNQLKAYFS